MRNRVDNLHNWLQSLQPGLGNEATDYIMRGS
jgi:hypothetical protein